MSSVQCEGVEIWELNLKEKWTWYILYRKVNKALKIRGKKGDKAMVSWLKKWLKEPSTISAIITAAGAIGITMGPDVAAAFAGAVLALVVLWDAIRKDQGKGRDE